MSLLREGERIDDLQRNGYKIIQDPSLFCFGMDAVLLADFARANEGERCMDLCSGSGVIPILMEARCPGACFCALEIQIESADMAARSVRLDHLEDKIEITCGDLKDASKIFGASSFDVVTVNPPYLKAGAGLINPDGAKAIARHEILCTLEDVVREGARLLKPSGRFYMVHRPARLSEIISLMSTYRIEPKRLRLVYPYTESPANLVLIEGLRGGRTGMDVEKPLIVYKSPGVYTDEIYKIYGYGE